jgi:hypothetical protein
MLNICSSYAVWGCDLGRRIAQTKDNFGIEVGPGQDAAALVFSCVDDLLFAMSTVDTFEPAPGLAKQITGLLMKSRASVAYDNSPEASRSPTSVFDKIYGEISLNDPSPGALSVTSEDSSTSGSGGQPFHYFYNKGNKLDLGDSVREIGRQTARRSVSDSSPPFTSTVEQSASPSSNEMDVVMQLAQAALPNQKNSRSDAQQSFAVSMPNNVAIRAPAGSSSAFSLASIGQTPPQQQHISTEALYGPALDLNLAAITGVDSQWLHDYLNSSSHLPGSATASVAPTSSSQYVQQRDINTFPQSATMPFNAGSAQFTIPEWSIGADSGKPINVEQATSQAVGLDLQWDQLMANAGDAQLWAESQWQGFSFA